jgi:hypothetical protein
MTQRVTESELCLASELQSSAQYRHIYILFRQGEPGIACRTSVETYIKYTDINHDLYRSQSFSNWALFKAKEITMFCHVYE